MLINDQHVSEPSKTVVVQCTVAYCHPNTSTVLHYAGCVRLKNALCHADALAVVTAVPSSEWLDKHHRDEARHAYPHTSTASKASNTLTAHNTFTATKKRRSRHKGTLCRSKLAVLHSYNASGAAELGTWQGTARHAIRGPQRTTRRRKRNGRQEHPRYGARIMRNTVRIPENGACSSTGQGLQVETAAQRTSLMQDHRQGH